MNHPTLIVPIDNRIELLPFHLTYYMKQGWRRFVFALWNGADNPCYKGVIGWWDQLTPKDGSKFGYEMFIRETLRCEYNAYNGPAEAPGLNKIRQELVAPEDWYAVADLDEFYWFYWPNDPIRFHGALKLYEMIEFLTLNGYEAAQGYFHDRVTWDSSFPSIPEFPSGSLDKTFPVDAYLTRNAHWANITKITLAKGHCEIWGGHHRTSDGAKIADNTCEVHHFKWHHGVEELLQKRFEAYSSQNLAWAPESKWLSEFFTMNKQWVQDRRLKMRTAVELGI